MHRRTNFLTWKSTSGNLVCIEKRAAMLGSWFRLDGYCDWV